MVMDDVSRDVRVAVDRDGRALLVGVPAAALAGGRATRLIATVGSPMTWQRRPAGQRRGRSGPARRPRRPLRTSVAPPGDRAGYRRPRTMERSAGGPTLRQIGARRAAFRALPGSIPWPGCRTWRSTAWRWATAWRSIPAWPSSPPAPTCCRRRCSGGRSCGSARGCRGTSAGGAASSPFTSGSPSSTPASRSPASGASSRSPTGCARAPGRAAPTTCGWPPGSSSSPSSSTRVLASLAYAAALVVRLRDEEARLARLAELQTRAELKALRARLDPHFLFNTLHSLLALVRRDPRAAEEALERFGDLLHYVLRGQEERRGGARWRRSGASCATTWRSRPCGWASGCASRRRSTPTRGALPGAGVHAPAAGRERHPPRDRRRAPAAGGSRCAAAVDGGLLHVEVADDGPGAEPDEVERRRARPRTWSASACAPLHGARAALAGGDRAGRGASRGCGFAVPRRHREAGAEADA